MLANVESMTSERRHGTQHALTKFVQHRSEMLSLYWRVAGLQAFDDEEQNTDDRLKDFCEVLIDYIAAGHFTLYDRISTGQERRQKTKDLAAQLYPKIANMTEVAVAFSDKYEANKVIEASELTDDLSTLGEALATRIELEDQLIESLA